MFKSVKSHIALWLAFAFFFNSLGPIPTAKAEPIYSVEGEFHLPAPGILVPLSPSFDPPILKGIKVHPEDPFRFDFILDQGDEHQPKAEVIKLIKYFLASLTIPERDLWVNLSPYEKERIIPQSFGFTEMGRDLLAEDYMLKQITASLIYPEGEVGKKFWKRVYEEAEKKLGTTNIPVNTFNKVWIVPEKAVVYENAKAGTAYIVESKLKVMLEQDYLALEKNSVMKQSINNVGAIGSQIVREIVIPELSKEVNEDKNFAQLRQVYNSLILATWYKKKIQDSILEQVYEDKKKVEGIGYGNSLHTEAIYQRYLQAFKKGVYNYIKEDQDSLTRQMVPRKYFSGGFGFTTIGIRIDTKKVDDHAMLSYLASAAQRNRNRLGLVSARLKLSSEKPVVDSHPIVTHGPSIAIIPDHDRTAFELLVPNAVVLDPRISGLIHQLRRLPVNFAMISDGKGHWRVTFVIKEQWKKIKFFLNFMPWARYLANTVLAGIPVVTPIAVFLHSESIGEIVGNILEALILVVVLWEYGKARFMEEHDYHIDILESFYETGLFSNGHSSREANMFYKLNYQDFLKNLDDKQEVQTLELIAGTLSEEAVKALRQKKNKGNFEQRLLLALAKRENEKNEFMQAHNKYLNAFESESGDRTRPLPRPYVIKAMQFYIRNDEQFRHFLNKADQEKIAELLSKSLPKAQKDRILDSGPNQPTLVQKLMYWDLEAEGAELEKDRAMQSVSEKPSFDEERLQRLIDRGLIVIGRDRISDIVLKYKVSERVVRKVFEQNQSDEERDADTNKPEVSSTPEQVKPPVPVVQPQVVTVVKPGQSEGQETDADQPVIDETINENRKHLIMLLSRNKNLLNGKSVQQVAAEYDLPVEMVRALNKQMGWRLTDEGSAASAQSLPIIAQSHILGHPETASEPEIRGSVPTTHPSVLPPDTVLIGYPVTQKKSIVQGGIDFTFNRRSLEVQNSKGSIKISIDPAMLQRLQDAPGFVPVITGYQPLNDVAVFLGITAGSSGIQ